MLLVYTLWRHLSTKPSFSRLYVLIAICVFAATTVGRFTRIFFRNFVWLQPYASTKVTQTGDAVRLQIKVSQPWRIHAGQYIYVWMPGVSFWSTFQSHPFMISWWDQDINGKGTNIYLLVKPRSGFTRKLLSHIGALDMKTIIDGPYGAPTNIMEYGNVLMFASGIGIAAQVPHIKEVLRAFRESKARTKSILLIWQLDKESKLF